MLIKNVEVQIYTKGYIIFEFWLNLYEKLIKLYLYIKTNNDKDNI